MDTVSKLKKQNLKVAVQARRLNNAANRILNEKMAKIEDNHERRTNSLQKETERMESILQQLHDTPRSYRSSSNCSSLASDDEYQLPSFREKRSSPVIIQSAWSGAKHEEVKYIPCRYTPRKKMTDCKYFPCHLPDTYQPLGFQSYPTNYTSLSNYETLSRRSRPQTAVTQSNSHPCNVENISSSKYANPRLTVKDKIRGLNIYVKGLRTKHEKKKPQPWEVRYGEPIPRRLLLKTAVPVSIL